MKKTVLTSGVDCEYVLGELAERLRQKGWEVIELEFGTPLKCVEDLLRRLPSKNIVYITSAHANLSLRLAESMLPSFERQYRGYLSPLEILSRVKPGLSIYVPHDLLTPYGDTNLNEFRYLNLFDHILAPYGSDALQSVLFGSTLVWDAGWIKYTEAEHRLRYRPKEVSAAPGIQMFLSLVVHLQAKYGAEGIVEYLRPLLKPNVHVKLPRWKGSEEIERALRQQALVQIDSATEKSTKLIAEADLVVCNSASSIHAESALMGRTTICLLDDEGIQASEQRRKLSHLPNFYFHDYREKAPLHEALIEDLRRRPTVSVLRPFRFDIVEQILLSAELNSPGGASTAET